MPLYFLYIFSYVKPGNVDVFSATNKQYLSVLPGSANKAKRELFSRKEPQEYLDIYGN